MVVLGSRRGRGAVFGQDFGGCGHEFVGQSQSLLVEFVDSALLKLVLTPLDGEFGIHELTGPKQQFIFLLVTISFKLHVNFFALIFELFNPGL
jgi:hypothetical protein